MTRKTRFDREQEIEIIRRYKTGESCATIGKALGMSGSGIKSLLVRCGIEMRARWDLVSTDEQRNQMVADYLAGNSITWLAKKYNLHKTTIWAHLKNKGVVLRSASECHRQYAIDVDAFLNAEHNPEAAYWIGCLMSDGCNYQKKTETSPSVVAFALCVDDKEQVLKFRQFLKSDHPIKTVTPEERGGYKSEKNAISLHIVSKPLAVSLLRYGVTPRKSLTAKVFVLQNNLHFWRGVVDGDATVSMADRGRPILDVCGSKPLMEQLQKFVKTIIPNCRANVRWGETCWHFRLGCSTASKVLQHLRYEEHVPALDRKRDMAIQCINWKPKVELYCYNGTLHKFSRSAEQGIVALYQSGEKIKQIARQYNTSNSTIRVILVRRGVAIRASKVTPEQTREIVRRYKAGDSPEVIGKTIGYSSSGIVRILVRCNVPRRRPGRPR